MNNIFKNRLQTTESSTSEMVSTESSTSEMVSTESSTSKKVTTTEEITITSKKEETTATSEE